jgi:hypothetical protein
MTNVQLGATLALAEATNLVERCIFCELEIKGEPFDVNDYDEPFCSKSCVEDCRDREAESAHDRMVEDFYGGSSPQTLDEQMEAARRLK